ncbi:MAG: L,D-transpeptidase [Myxococcota bacterium]
MVPGTVVRIALGLGLAGAAVGGAAGGCAGGCTESDAEAREARERPETARTDFDGTEEAPATDEETRERRDRIEREYPLHGVVTGVHLAAREAPDPEAPAVGWLRIGSRVRLAEDVEKTGTCSSGWYRVHPRGWVCAGLGVEVEPQPPEVELVVDPPRGDDALPYAYHFIKENMVPEYHRLPSRDEQRAAQAYADRYFEILEESERRAEHFLRGELEGELEKPAVVRRYLERGFYVAGTAVEVRAFRRFVRTVWGSYVKEARTVRRTGSGFQGVELDDDQTLPLAFALRAIRPLVREPEEDGPDRFKSDEEAEVFERQSVVEAWVARERIGDRVYHRLEIDGEPRYARAWFIGVAERVEAPSEVREGEPWVHVDLSEQTLVLYRGDEPVYATLVSTGVDEHATPTGVFTIDRKLISDTMSDLGPEAGDDRYRIEDVPWTQYFDGSVALHGAFWHNRFGLQRSHGCVNMSPRDAHRVFLATWPRVPEGWHGVTTDGTGLTPSHVVVTE